MQSYNLLQKNLHHLVLKSPFVKKALFDIEKMIFLKKNDSFKSEKHIFITGLPRSGTTILLEFIYQTKEFASLTYADMPFIMAPNLFNKMFRNHNIPLKERMHKDGIKFDLKSPEAFDEVFFKTYNEQDCLNNLDVFVSLVLKKYKKNKYLSKNNNNYKRIHLINSVFPYSIILIPYRDPLQQAYSLLNQHRHFCDLQKKEKFILDYMNYLGHREFGLNYQSWNLSLDYSNAFAINYWLEQWYLFYNNIIEYSEKNKNVVLVSYDEICKNQELVQKLISKINLSQTDYSNFFKLSLKNITDNYDKKILSKCLEIQERMKSLNNNLSYL